MFSFAAASLLALAVVSIPAHADVYQIDFGLGLPGGPPATTEGSVFTFDTSKLNGDPYVDFACGGTSGHDCFIAQANGEDDYVVVFRNGFVGSADPVFYPDLPGNFQFSGSGPFFTGPDTDPHVVTGNYLLSQGETHTVYDYGIATITDLTTSPVPEPSSLALMGTGILSGLAVIRRRSI